MADKIHFINKIDYTNVGDMKTSPLEYYWDFFKNYTIVRHDLNAVKFNVISPDDVVILGGGGILYLADSWNKIINSILNASKNVIGWGAGFNTHKDLDEKKSAWRKTFGWLRLNAHKGRDENREEVQFDRFLMIGVRDPDNKHGLTYVPCVSCKSPELEKKLPVKRDIGVISHKNFPLNFPYETITNNSNFDTVTDFIASSQAIITNSYHMAYWTQLMCRKVIVANPFSSRFDSYQSHFYSGDLAADLASAKIEPDALKNARALNDKFFEKVKTHIEAKLVRRADDQQQKLYQLDRLARIEWIAEENQEQLRNLKDDSAQKLHDKGEESRRQIEALKSDFAQKFEESRRQIETLKKDLLHLESINNAANQAERKTGK